MSSMLHLEPNGTTAAELDGHRRASPWQLALSADAIERLLLFAN